LQLDRVDYRRATQVALAIEAMFCGGELDRAWFDATAQDEGAVEATALRANLARKLAALRTERGF
jgi:hypothetical protein